MVRHKDEDEERGMTIRENKQNKMGKKKAFFILYMISSVSKGFSTSKDIKNIIF